MENNIVTCLPSPTGFYNLNFMLFLPIASGISIVEFTRGTRPRWAALIFAGVGSVVLASVVLLVLGLLSEHQRHLLQSGWRNPRSGASV